MIRQITLENQKISYTLRQKKHLKRLRLIIYCGGEMVVSAPPVFTVAKIEEFIMEKSGWILKKLPIMKKRNANSVLRRRSKKEYLERKKEALELVLELIEKFNKHYNFKFNKISVRNQKTRWGSCSGNRNLSFNYKIIFLPRCYAEYIVVHELCHLEQFNHSPKFWDLVEKTVPNCRKFSREIRLM